VAVGVPRVSVTKHWRKVRSASHRLSWGVADQGMSSLTNFLLSAIVARSLGAREFGAFTLAYVTYGFALNASRGLAVEPLMIRFSGTDLPTWRRATAGSTGTGLIVGVAAGICALAAGLVAGGTTGQAFLALGLTLPLLLLQDSWRYAFFALGKGQHAFFNDAVWLVVQIPLLLILKVTGHADVFWFVIAWGGAAGAGAVFGIFQARVLPSVVSAGEWLVRHRDLGPRYMVENTGTNSADMLRSYGVTSILGLVAVGYIQAASVLLGPFKIILFGISMTAIPEGARILRHSPRRLPLFCAAVSLGLTVLALAWGLVLLAALPHGLGQLLLGGLWRPAYPLVLATTVSAMANCAGIGAAMGLHALGASRRSMRIGIITPLFVVGCGLVGALVAGVLGSLYFAAAASWICVLLYWWQLREALRERGGLEMIPAWLWRGTSGRRGQEPAAADVAAAAGAQPADLVDGAEPAARDEAPGTLMADAPADLEAESAALVDP
jgi:O-antigen/teichoic acid export membrane protein